MYKIIYTNDYGTQWDVNFIENGHIVLDGEDVFNESPLVFDTYDEAVTYMHRTQDTSNLQIRSK
ncbi:hypothetical protein AB0X56_02750 [Weissella paramesenteroides]|uniref:hypothetical protein n=1 Tax=Weissella paramesenteroides TaxID=1249 RepID=UPI002072B574|nr:hypothetical protein [Weissella paramesenteroides]MCM6765232.1 hypothetical protein [Weissella paramesenteroides]MCM6766603.1 hypothetical protein [Weissella paramesenteroides]MCM6771667.1 hypothetical protein [Weissella paramesenteroides]MCM6779240.1 hypothetical protein [Weissella paramesenteroides]MCM6782185.1 hypothetical protein [Weissella paramesenteroides]